MGSSSDSEFTTSPLLMLLGWEWRVELTLAGVVGFSIGYWQVL
jgi:hypothetical protein